MNRFSETYWKKPLPRRPGEAEPAASFARPMVESTTLLRGWVQHMEQQISTHPGTSLAVAVGVGFLFGWWLKRS